MNGEFVDTRMTPAEFEQYTGVSWNRVLNIIRKFGGNVKSIADNQKMAASVVDYMPSDEIMFDICRQLNGLQALTGHIYEALCLIYFGQKYNGAKITKDETNNPEYDIIVGNNCIQCKYSNNPNIINFCSVNKNYNLYKTRYNFCVISGTKTEHTLYKNIDRNMLQFASNFCRLYSYIDSKKRVGVSPYDFIQKIKNSGIKVIKGSAKLFGGRIDPHIFTNSDLTNRKASNSIDKLNYAKMLDDDFSTACSEILAQNFRGKLNLDSLIRQKDDGGERAMLSIRNGKCGTRMIMERKMLEEISSSKENLDMSQAVRKFVNYFENYSHIQKKSDELIDSAKRKLGETSGIRAKKLKNDLMLYKTVKNYEKGEIANKMKEAIKSMGMS